jgi:immunity protein Imm1 of predicted polymorphic toxin system
VSYSAGSVSFPTPGEDARFSFSDRRHSGDDWPDNYLVVSVNRSTGYGALIWYVTKDFPQQDGVYGQIWISDNPRPPDFDPRVVSDPGEPAYHDPRSAIPVADVRAALEEFCRTGHRLDGD